LSIELLCSMLLEDVGLPLGMASLDMGEAWEGGAGEAVRVSALATDVRRLCVLLEEVSELSRGVCLPETGMPVPRVAGSLSSSGSLTWTEADIVMTGEVVCACVVLWMSCGYRHGVVLDVAAWAWEELEKGGRRAYPWRERLQCDLIRQKVTSSVSVLVIEW
jgi:hypothetical protein